MFYAIHTTILSEANAIALMPILFYAPWAIFCTLAGYYADKYSKTVTLRIWKGSEIVISALLMLGFYLGSNAAMPHVGGWIVMSCVFLMGTHAAFFAPAKYGAMPEILQPHILSRGNGILESTTFLASILGTVSGGLLFYVFGNVYAGQEIYIGVILFVLSVIGAAASFMIAWLPAASPEKAFPAYLFKPLYDNLKIMFRSRPLALAMLGIAFFIFMVAYMRAAMYMHGETRNPRWDEQKTSLIVATVALGVGLGSPLAGYLSGGKIELGLVPLGCLGMIFALVISALAIEVTWVLVIALIIIGFFSGFYMVPLYTLLQHRAPKKSKGELVATSNFINVTGAIAASVLFKLLVLLSQVSGLTPEVKLEPVTTGVIQDIATDKHGKIQRVVIKRDIDENERIFAEEFLDEELEELKVIDTASSLLDALSGAPGKGDEVVLSSYVLRGRLHYLIRKADQPLGKVYDTANLPRYLFIGAALMTVGILILLCRKLPDFFVRSLFWFRTIGKFRLKAVGMSNLPTEGPVILATNCHDMQGCLQLVSATDRTTKVILFQSADVVEDGALLRLLALRTNLLLVRSEAELASAQQEALSTLHEGHLLAVGVMNQQHAGALAALLEHLQQATAAPILPVFCGSIEDGTVPGLAPRVRVVFGEIAPPAIDPTAIRAGEPIATAFTASSSAEHSLERYKAAIEELGDHIRRNDDVAGEHH
jgi:MFS family permease